MSQGLDAHCFRSSTFLFSTARQSREPAIIFIDEVEAFLWAVERKHRQRSIALQLIKEIEEINAGKHKVFVIAATNSPWDIDKACLTLFNLLIYVPLPDFQTRRHLYELLTRDLTTEDLDCHDLARFSEGFTSSQIRDIVRRAVMKAFSERANYGMEELRPITMADFRFILEEKPAFVDVSLDLLEKYNKWHRRYNPTA